MEARAIISVNTFLHSHEYFYTDNKTVLELLQSFVIITSVPLVIEWFFASVSLAIETRYQNRQVMAVWRKQWKRRLMVAIINALPMGCLDEYKPVVSYTGTICQHQRLL